MGNSKRYGSQCRFRQLGCQPLLNDCLRHCSSNLLAPIEWGCIHTNGVNAPPGCRSEGLRGGADQAETVVVIVALVKFAAAAAQHMVVIVVIRGH